MQEHLIDLPQKTSVLKHVFYNLMAPPDPHVPLLTS